MTAVADPGVHVDEHEEGHAHPSDATYWKVGGFLAVLTGLEVSTIYWPENVLTSVALIVMMVIKFVTVAAFFMHLKYDAKILQNFLIVGLFLALGCYAAMAGALNFWEDGGNKLMNDTPRDQPLPPAPTDPPPVTTAGGGGH